MLAQILILLFSNLFARNLRKAPPPLPVETKPEPTDLGPVAKPAPQIIVPKPENQDNHGPASAIARAMLKNGHVIFSKDHQPHNLNIVAVRAKTPAFDKFNDRFIHFWKYDGQWHIKSWPWTTLPGKTYMVDRLLSPRGCAILVPGQYRDVYRIDRHRGIYPALCQRNGSVRVYRDKDRDREYDMVASTIQTGSFGINVHATENPDDGVSNPVADRIASASAGCLVSARVADFVEARSQWNLSRALWGDNFTLTLLNEADIDDLGETPLEEVDPQHSDVETWTPAGQATTGTRNRNLLNVKQGRDPWKYSTGKDSRGHAIFPNYAAGLRAGIITLRTYWTKHKLRSLTGITNRWAPASDTVGSLPGRPRNQPNAYAAYLANKMDIAVTDTLMTFHDDGSIRSADQLYRLVNAMAKMENHNQVEVPRSVFDKALTLL